MPGRSSGTVMAVAALLLAGCASDSEREWRVAEDPRATADEIIDAGHAVGIATNKDQMVVTWEVRPEDDEGPYQGAWRLYDRNKGRVADGTFGTIREASARIDVVAIPDGFLLTDYAKNDRYVLDVEGRLIRPRFETSKLGPSLAGGVLVSDESSDGAWSVLLPAEQRIVPLTNLPTKNAQGIELTSDGTVWVLLPWAERGPFRVAFAQDGKPPWTTETIPLADGSTAGGWGFSAIGQRLFVVGSHPRGERSVIDVILSRDSGQKGSWRTIDATGIADNLVEPPRLDVARKGRLVATAGSEGGWIQNRHGSGFTALHPPRSHKRARPIVSSVGSWLWSSEELVGNSLHYSYDYGRTWREFDR